jgi:hypothetical protein
MNIFSRIMRNAQVVNRLKKKYYNITSTVGVLAVAVGLSIMVALPKIIAPLLGIDLDADYNLEGQLLTISIIFLLGITYLILCLYIGLVLTAGLFSLIMFKLEKLSKQEAINYALYSDYPEYWFREKP